MLEASGSDSSWVLTLFSTAAFECVQPVITVAAQSTRTQLVDVIGRTNRMYTVACTMIVRPFHRPPKARNGHIVVQGDKAGYGKLKASELARLLRTLPHIVDSIAGCDRYHAAVHFCKYGRWSSDCIVKIIAAAFLARVRHVACHIEFHAKTCTCTFASGPARICNHVCTCSH